MRKTIRQKIGALAPLALATGILLFTAAYFVHIPFIKNPLLLIGLTCVVTGVIGYPQRWKQ